MGLFSKRDKGCPKAPETNAESAQHDVPATAVNVGARRARIQTTFARQAEALFRKNGRQQLRAWKVNLCLLSCAAFFPLFLLLIQGLINGAISGDQGKCGCLCLQCCAEDNEDDCFNPAALGRFTCPNDLNGTSYECKQVDESRCGLQYSTARQAAYCPQLNPASWPPLFQVPKPEYRAKPWAPGVAMLYTASDLSTADELAAGMFATPAATPGQSAADAAAVQEFVTALRQGQYRGEMWSKLGFNLSSQVASSLSGYVDPAFIRGEDVYNLVRDCETDESTSALDVGQKALAEALNSDSSGGSTDTQFLAYNTSFVCTQVYLLRNDSTDDLNRQLYCGFGQTATEDGKCPGGAPSQPNQYAQAWDWANSSAAYYGVSMYFNSTDLPYKGGPWALQRVNAGFSMSFNSWLQWALGDDVSGRLLAMQAMPKDGSEFFLDFSALLGPIFYTWLLSLVLPLVVYSLVTEKVQGLRTMMAVHGLGARAYWLLTFSYFFVLYVLFIVILVFFGWVAGLTFFKKTGLGLQVVFYLIWGCNLVSLGFLLSTLFSSARTAATGTFVYIFAAGLLGAQLLDYYISRNYAWLYVVELVPQFALYRSLYEICQRAFLAADSHFDEFGANWSNITFSGLGAAMLILAVQVPIFLGLALYFDLVLPSRGRPRQHWLFFWPAAASAWDKATDKMRSVRKRGGSKLVPLDSSHQQPAAAPVAAASVQMVAASAKPPPVNGNGALPGRHAGPAAVPHVVVVGAEPGMVGMAVESEEVAAERQRVQQAVEYDPTGASHAILVQELRKVYPHRGNVPPHTAVAGVSLAIQHGECFGLLGPNGAGKSTLLSMLTGFLEPSSGSAHIEGLDVRQDMRQIYSMMGVCPQADLLWGNLTAREHLRFYGRLKNLRGQALAEEVTATLASVNLLHGGLADRVVAKFSGGMKRRLSVAIALIGHPLVMYLDEPSTGLDPASRRTLWDAVASAKADRAVVLTTHSMEEAAVLCDRLGIIVDGRLVVVGNPKYLAQRYGGYLVFTITTPPEQAPAAARFVQQLCPGAKQTYALNGTQKYEIPSGSITLSAVFEAVERVSTSSPPQSSSAAEAAPGQANSSSDLSGREELQQQQQAAAPAGAGEGGAADGGGGSRQGAAAAAGDGGEQQQGLTVLDWGVSNATLEEVFIKFARSIGARGGN